MRIKSRLTGKFKPRVILLGLPLLAAAADGSVLIYQRLQNPSAQAIRIVKESNSRIENFSIQQYLYATLYHEAGDGNRVRIIGWTAHPLAANRDVEEVDFGFAVDGVERTATWEVHVKAGTVYPVNRDASELSWND